MSFIKIIFIVIFLVPSIVFSEEKFSPTEAAFTFDANPLLKMCGPNQATVWRYLTGNPRWEVRKEIDYAHNRDKRAAFRMEDNTKDPFAKYKGYQPSLNGFYSREKLQSRVLISIRGIYGYGRDEGQMTRVALAPNKKVDLRPILERADKYGLNGHTSYVILETPCEITLEIMEQQLTLDRPFTKQTIKEIGQEIEELLAHKKEIESSGRYINPKFYPVVPPSHPSIDVLDGSQPGIYIVNAWLSQKQEGEAYVRVFRESDNKEVFKRRRGDESLRTLGFDVTGKNLFRYTSEVMLSEGDWSSQYMARFEVWVDQFESEQPKKVIEFSRMVNGWER